MTTRPLAATRAFVALCPQHIPPWGKDCESETDMPLLQAFRPLPLWMQMADRRSAGLRPAPGTAASAERAGTKPACFLTSGGAMA